ncbi:MAG: hypothetical protein MK211_00120 [Flavobacteriales bacterium]|nr:hypothetical protein [Flavobacteriales bacterium]
MSLERTTIIPLDDPDQATELFNNAIDRLKTTVMFIIGNTETVQEAIPNADHWAGETLIDLERWVVWLRDHEILKTEMQQLLENTFDPDFDEPYDTIKCFCLSPISKRAIGFILKNGSLANVRLLLSFAKVEAIDA